MKKIISILLTVLLILSCASICTVAAENDLTVTVANDIHLNLKLSTTPVKKHNSVSEDFFHAGHSGQMPEESLALAMAFLELAAEDESDILLLPGDLVDVGMVEENVYFATMLAEFEAKSGKSVYVVPGNHDLFATTVDEFKTIYAAFGYSEAIAHDTLSASYVAELNSEYRLLAIDSTIPGDSPHGVDEHRLAWIRQQCEQAAKDGKKMMAIMHHNLLEHFILGDTLHGGAIVDGDVALAETLATNGVKFIFTGHTHDHDVASYTASDGSVIYDILTSTLFSYPCPYRVVTFSDKVNIETRRITSVDASLLPEGITDNARALAESDMTEYSKQCTWIGVRSVINSYVSSEMLVKLLDLDKTEDAEMYAIIEKVGDKLNESLKMPMYAKDVQQGEMSIEGYLAEYDIEIPATEYKDLTDLAVTLYEVHVVGDENYPGYSNEVVLLSKALAAVLHYSLADVSAEEYATVLSYVTQLLGYDINTDFLLYAGSAVTRMQGLEIVVTTVLVPVICEFTVDNAPDDINVTLPGYNMTEEADDRNFFEMIIDFFDELLSALRTFFTYLFG